MHCSLPMAAASIFSTVRVTCIRLLSICRLPVLQAGDVLTVVSMADELPELAEIISLPVQTEAEAFPQTLAEQGEATSLDKPNRNNFPQ
jgi:hypothetical protein